MDRLTRQKESLSARRGEKTTEKGGEVGAHREGSEAVGELLNGWILFDFYRSEKGLIDLLISFNFL